MNPGNVWRLTLVLLLGRMGDAQTNCAIRHAGRGVFVCFPNPSESIGDSPVSDIFHLSAQANAADGQTINRYRILIDHRLAYQEICSPPIQRLSIEQSVKSPFDSGSHSLQLVVDGAGLTESTEVRELQFRASKGSRYCDRFGKPGLRVCNANTRSPLRWSLTESTTVASTHENAPEAAEPFDRYIGYLNLYAQNLKSIEADVSDAIEVDAQGNTYVAAHVFADVQLRKYTPDGSIIYDSLIRSCGDGFLSVAGLAADKAGRIWIAGNTTACLRTTPNAVESQIKRDSRASGFVMLVDTTKPSSTVPLYVTYLSDVENQIAAIRVDGEGNAYVTGTTASLRFPHGSLLPVVEGASQHRNASLGFVSVLKQSGSGFLWSTLLQNSHLTALALDGMGNVYVTGRIVSRQSPSGSQRAESARHSDDVLVAELSDYGRQLSYVTSFGGVARQEGRAISTTSRGAWVFVTGDTDSPQFLTSSLTNASHSDGLSFAVALQPCRTGILYARLLSEMDNRTALGIALTPALDAFTATWSGYLDRGELRKSPAETGRVHVAPECSTPTI
jgi:hypothetical protein